MPGNNENVHVKATPHFDGEKESIINDSTASAGSKMGFKVILKWNSHRREIHSITLLNRSGNETI